MIRWTLGFLLVAILAAVFGFGGISEVATDLSRLLFLVFLVLFVLSSSGYAFRGQSLRVVPLRLGEWR